VLLHLTPSRTSQQLPSVYLSFISVFYFFDRRVQHCNRFALADSLRSAHAKTKSFWRINRGQFRSNVSVVYGDAWRRVLADVLAALPRIGKTSFPVGMDMSICSDRPANSMPNLTKVSRARGRWDTDRPSE
jgi:hypothetical protein